MTETLQSRLLSEITGTTDRSEEIAECRSRGAHLRADIVEGLAA